jgi:hypothetical protein
MNCTLTFGRYKGRTIEDLWMGKNSEIDNDLINAYLNDFLDFLFNRINPQEKVLVNNYYPDKRDSKLIYSLREKSEFRELIDIKNDNIFFGNDLDVKLKSDIRLLLLNVFNSSAFTSTHFNAWGDPSLSDEDDVEFTQASKNLADKIPDPDYIRWLYKETDVFSENYVDYERLKLQPSFYAFIMMHDKDNSGTINFKYLSKVIYRK